MTQAGRLIDGLRPPFAQSKRVPRRRRRRRSAIFANDPRVSEIAVLPQECVDIARGKRGPVSSRRVFERRVGNRPPASKKDLKKALCYVQYFAGNQRVRISVMVQ